MLWEEQAFIVQLLVLPPSNGTHTDVQVLCQVLAAYSER